MAKKRSAAKRSASPPNFKKKAAPKQEPSPPAFKKKAPKGVLTSRKTRSSKAPRTAKKAVPERSTPWRLVPLGFFEGNTLITSAAALLDDLPQPYQRVLTTEHRAAMADEPAYFRGLAAQCSLPWMKRWLEDLAQADAWELHLSVDTQHSQVETGIQAIYGGRPWGPFGRRWGPLVRLREPDQAVRPRALPEVFDWIAGTYDAPFVAGGFLHDTLNLTGDFYDEFRPPVLVRDPSALTMVFRDACGDMLLAEGDRAIWHLHETNAFVDAGPLLDVVDGYFRMLVDGTNWFGDLYELWRRQNPGKPDRAAR